MCFWTQVYSFCVKCNGGFKTKLNKEKVEFTSELHIWEILKYVFGENIWEILKYVFGEYVWEILKYVFGENISQEK